MSKKNTNYNYHFYLIGEKVTKGKFGWWYRFCLKYLLRTEITRTPVGSDKNT